MDGKTIDKRHKTLAYVKKSLEDCLPLLDAHGGSVAGAHIDSAINALTRELLAKDDSKK